MTYRDQTLQCVRCGAVLDRDTVADVWDCTRCHGMLVGVGTLVDQLLLVAPDLTTPGARTIATPSRRPSEKPLPCPACRRPLAPVYLGGVDVDRCYEDELVWFDGGEHALVIDRAEEQYADRATWWGRLRATFRAR